MPLRAEDALEHLGKVGLMAASNARPVLIAGGGIGGLAAALGLAQKGIRSILLEKASALGEIGAGIQLGPNAFHAFDYLGVGEAARGMAVYIDQLRLMDALTAEEITHVDLGEAFRARFGNPYAVVHRGDLHGVFLKACRDHALIELRVSSEVIGYDQDGSSVTARLAYGERVTGALLIGADGLWSNVRKQVTARRPAAGVRPHHLSLGDSDRARCRRICAGTRRRCGPARNATSCIIRCRAGRCSTSSSPITTTRRSRSPASRCPTKEVMQGFAPCA